MSSDQRQVKVILAGEDQFSGVFRRYQDDLAKAAAGTDRLALSTSKVGVSAAQTAAAIRTVPAQITDALTQLQGGASPLTVLLQQGGQLKDSFGGIVPAAKGLASAVAGMVNPFTVAAAAAAALAVAYAKGSDEADQYAKALILTGNAQGLTTGRLQAMAKALDGVVGTQGAAADALAALASTGKVGADNMGLLAEAAVRVQRTVGTAVEETASQFAELGRSPVEASAKLNESTRFLTVSVYNQIRALSEQGRETDAARLAQNAYAEALISRTKEIEDGAGLIQRAWKSVRDTVAEAWDAMAGIGRPNTMEEQIAQLERLRDSQGAVAFPADKATLDARAQGQAAINAQIQALKNAKQIADEYAASVGKYQQQQAQGIAASQAIDRLTESTASKQDKLNKALGDYRTNLDKVRAANPNDLRLLPEAIAKAEKAIRDAFKEQAAPKGQSEAQRYIEQLQKQAEKAQELTVYEQALKDIQEKRISGITPQLEQQILLYAKEVDVAKAAAEAQKKAAKETEERKKQGEDFQRVMNEALARDQARTDALLANTTVQRAEDARKAIDRIREALQRPENQSADFASKAIEAIEQLQASVNDATPDVQDRFADIQKAIESTMLKSADAIVEFAVSGQGSIADLGKAFAQDVLRSIILKPVQDVTKLAASFIVDTFKSISLSSATGGGSSFNWGGLFGAIGGLFGGGGSTVPSAGIVDQLGQIGIGWQGMQGRSAGVQSAVTVGTRKVGAGAAAAGVTYVDNSVMHVNGDVSPATVRLIEQSRQRTKAEIQQSMRRGGAFARG